MRTFAAEIKPQVADEVPMKKRSAEELEAENKKLSTKFRKIQSELHNFQKYTNAILKSTHN